MSLVVVLVTAPTPEKGAEIGQLLVTEKLAACVNIIPGIRSIYQWEGKIQDDPEVLLLIKSTQDTLAALEKRVLEIHPYTTPEFVVLAPSQVSKAYDAWAKECVTHPH